MNIVTITRGNLKIFEVAHGDNVFRLTPFGGQLLAWEKSGAPILFENQSMAVTDGKTAYRGGAPIIFPYFGKGLLMPLNSAIDPQHGLARKSMWEVIIAENHNHLVFSTSLKSSAPYPETSFTIELAYVFADDITIQTSIRNIGSNACPIQCAVHSYWRTDSLAETAVFGLGNSYFDNLNNLTLTTDLVEKNTLSGEKRFTAPVDRTYVNPDSRLQVTTSRYLLDIQTSGVNAAVVWNPGLDHGLKDLGNPNFLCVESGIVFPCPTIAPSASVSHSITYTAKVR